MDRHLARGLRLIATQLVLVTALVHFTWGFPRLFVYLDPAAIDLFLSTEALPDPRPVLFVLSSSAILAGVAATWRGHLSLSTAYKLGTVMMGIYLGGWILWHTTGHGEWLFQGTVTRAGTPDHHVGILHTIVDHVLRSPVETAAKSAEAGAAILFISLLRRDPALDDDE